MKKAKGHYKKGRKGKNHAPITPHPPDEPLPSIRSIGSNGGASSSRAGGRDGMAD